MSQPPAVVLHAAPRVDALRSHVPSVPVVVLAPSHALPGTHGWPGAHMVPTGAYETHALVSALQVRPGPHVVNAAQESPGAAAAALQTPHAAPGAIAQNDDAHWAGNARSRRCRARRAAPGNRAAGLRSSR